MVGNKVRVKSLNEVLRIEGVEHYDDVGNPWITDFMLEHFGKEGLITACNEYYCMVLFDEDEWEFKKEWLEEIETTRAEETVASLEKDSHLYYKIKNEEGAVLGAYKVEYEPTKRIINPSYDDLKPLFIKTDTDEHVEGVVKMKTNKFIEKVQELGYEVVNYDYNINVYRENDGLARVSKVAVNMLDTYSNEDIPDLLFNILINYASTPIEERKDKQRYYLYNPVRDAYFNYFIGSGTYNWDSKKQSKLYQAQFTEEEIENHNLRDLMELLVREEVK